MFESSAETDKLDQALSLVQVQLKNAKKDQNNPFFNSKYADLESVYGACREALGNEGINVTQWPIASQDGKVYLMTRVAMSGQWMRATFSCPVSKQDPQGYKSAVTYLRRTCLEAIIGIASVDDDDGNVATHGSPKPEKKPENYADKFKKTEKVENYPPPIDFSHATSQEVNVSDWVIPFGKMKGTKISEIPKPKLQQYIAWLVDDASKKGQPIGKAAQELIDKCEAMWKISHLNPPPFDENDNIPF